MKQVVGLQSVNHGGTWRERDTIFTVVEEPKAALDVTPTQAADWGRWGWVKAAPANAATKGA